MNRRELRDELYALGHHYLEEEPGRADRFIDQGAGDVMLNEPWPQRVVIDALSTQQPLRTLGTIEQVWVDGSSYPLTPTTATEIRDAYGTLEPTVGEPLYYWVVQNSYFWTWPALDASRTLMVEHVGKGIWEENAGERYVEAHSDESYLLGDGAFDEAVLLAARLRVLEDSDETGLRDTIAQRLETELVGLRFRELNTVADAPRYVEQTGPWY